MADLELLAAQSGLSMQELQDQLKLLNSQSTRFNAGRPDLTSIPDGPARSSKGMAAGKMADTAENALTAALAFADDLVTPAAKQAQMSVLNKMGGVGIGSGPVGHLSRFAASPKALMLAKVGTGIGALNSVLGAADILAGNDSLGNKLMDTAGMAIGGTIGAVGGPMGIAAGAGYGKAASDGLQWLFGDKKTADQRKLEEAIALLNRGGLG